MDDKTLLASSGEGTVQSFDLRYRNPDIQSEVIDAHQVSAIALCHFEINMMARPVGGHDDTLVGDHQITRLVDNNKKG